MGAVLGSSSPVEASRESTYPASMGVWRSGRGLWCALLMWLASACGLGHSDESVLRQEFSIPSNARLIRSHVSPEPSGWFGREGLRIEMVFQLEAGDWSEYVARARASDRWKPLPIPEVFLRRMARIETLREYYLRAGESTGQAVPAEGAPGNPTEAQLLESFQESLPPQPGAGLFQIRYSGTGIMSQPKSLFESPDRDLSDFMLAMLDERQQQILIKVSTSY